MSFNRVRTYRPRNCNLTQLLTSAVLVTVPVTSVIAQTAEELPPIIVEGASIAVSAPKAGKGGGAGQPSLSASAPSEGGDAGAQPAPADEGGGLAADSVGTAVTVVTGAELRARQVRHAGDALRSLPGVSVSRTGSAGGLTQVRIRGAEGNHTLVLIDGIEANDTFNGEFDFSDLPAEDIERIEVLRGGLSGLYGSGAVGGVVNIVTRGGKGPLTFSGHAEGGSFNTFDGSARASAGNDGIWGAISVNRFRTDGFDIAPFGNEDDGAARTAFSIRGGARVVEGLTLDYTLRHTEKEADRDTQTFAPSGIQIDDPATFNDKTWLGTAGLTWSTFDNALTQAIRAKWNETHRTDQSVFFGTPSLTDNLGERLTTSYVATYRFSSPELLGSSHAITGLIEHEDEGFTPSSDFGFGFAADGIERNRERLAVAGEYQGSFAERLHVMASIRHDDNDSFEDFTTWRTSATVKLPEIGLRPHASTGTSVKFPTMFEQFGFIPAFFIPNPDLLPEESFGWDAGAELSLFNGLALVDVTYFEADLENEIRGVGFPTTPINLDGRSERRGIEVAGRLQVTKDLRLGASYTWLDATDPDGAEEVRRPPHSGRLDLDYAFAGGLGNLNVAAVYNGDMKDTNFGPFPFTTVTLDDYWLVTAAASYKVQPGVELYGRVENALDQDYQEIYGFETAGIAAYAGVRLTYEEPNTRAWAEGR